MSWLLVINERCARVVLFLVKKKDTHVRTVTCVVVVRLLLLSPAGPSSRRGGQIRRLQTGHCLVLVFRTSVTGARWATVQPGDPGLEASELLNLMYVLTVLNSLHRDM